MHREEMLRSSNSVEFLGVFVYTPRGLNFVTDREDLRLLHV